MQYSGREALAIADPERGSCHHRLCEAAWVPAFASHPVGRFKAAFFLKYAIRATLVRPSGQSADVVSVWVVRRGEESPRFVTAYPEGDR